MELARPQDWSLMRRALMILAGAVGLSVPTVTPAAAQTVEEIVDAYRNGQAGMAYGLTALRSERPVEELRRLVDSLVVIAESPAGADPAGFARRHAAVSTIVLVTNEPGHGRVQSQVRAAFEGWVAGSADDELKAMALVWLRDARLSPGQVRSSYEDAARSEEFSAFVAIQQLIEWGDSGLPSLRRLFNRSEVSQPDAKQLLEHFAESRGWS